VGSFRCLVHLGRKTDDQWDPLQETSELFSGGKFVNWIHSSDEKGADLILLKILPQLLQPGLISLPLK
jgi:hypothetical protein